MKSWDNRIGLVATAIKDQPLEKGRDIGDRFANGSVPIILSPLQVVGDHGRRDLTEVGYGSLFQVTKEGAKDYPGLLRASISDAGHASEILFNER